MEAEQPYPLRGYANILSFVTLCARMTIEKCTGGYYEGEEKSMDCNYCIGSDWVLRRFYFGYNGEKDKQEQTNTQTRTQEKEIRAQGEMKDGELVDYTKNNMLELGKYKGRTVTVTPTETEVYQAILLEAEDWKKRW